MPIRARNTDIPFVAEVLLPDLAAAADITNYHVLKAPFDLEIVRIEAVPVVATVGVDGSNTLTYAFKKNNTGSAILSKAHTANLAQGSYNDVGTPTSPKLNKGDNLTLDITQGGTTADQGLVTLRVLYKARREAAQ